MNVMRRNDAEGQEKAGNQLPQVAVVILNWNGRKFLEQFMPSVLATTYENTRIIVADNYSTDDSVSFLQSAYPAVEIIRNESNQGFAQGYNAALTRVNSDYYVLLNSDIEVTPGWIEPVISLMESDPKIAACQPKILSWHNKKMFEYAGAGGGWIDSLGYPFARGRVFDVCEPDKGQYNDAAPCFWATGASLFIRADVFHKAGGFDPTFFAHQEEIDLCWRIQLMGYKVYAQPASVVYHVGGGTLPKGNSRKTFLNFRNNLLMMHRNLPWRAKWWKIPLRIGLDQLSAVRSLLKGDGGFFAAVIKAHLHYIGWLFTGKKRLPVTNIDQASLEGWYHGSVVWEYFIKGRKKFSEIVGRK